MEAFKVYEPQGMTSLARHVVLEVKSQSEYGWYLEGAGESEVARVASSCILAPAVGDRVLALISGHEAWVLAILDRPVTNISTLEFDGDVELRSLSGNVRIEADNELRLKSSGSTFLQGPRLRVSVAVADILTGRLGWIGEVFDVRFGKGNIVSQWVDSVVEKFSLRARNSIKQVEEVDQVRSGQIDYRADKNLSLKARNVLADASQLAKVNGKQIHLG